MKKRQTINVRVILPSIAVAALMLAMLPAQAHAQDSDGDGFTDAQESAGINFVTGVKFNGVRSIPSCVGTALTRANCVDPNSKDLFVILVRATPTLIPSDPLKFIAAPQAEGGLGIATHEISTTRSDRRVTSVLSQLAVKITESLNINGTDLGQSSQGLALDLATVFTQRIVNFVNSVCVAGTICVDSNSASNLIDTANEVVNHYIRHTIAHEGCGHPCDIAPDYNASFGGNHYKAGSVVVMEQNVTYKTIGTNVTWYISTAYPATDQAAANTIP